MGVSMEPGEKWDQKQVLHDPEMLSALEKKLRPSGMSRRSFLAMASAVAGTAALAACGGGSSPTATTAATRAPAAASPTTAAADAAAGSPTTAPASAAATRPTTASGTGTTGASGTASAGGTPATKLGPIAAAAVGEESKKVFLDWLTEEPVDNDFNRDLGGGGVKAAMVGLLRYSQSFDLIPELAEDYAVSGNVITFRIRKDANWSDGKPVTAVDFAYSIRRMIDPRTGNGYGSFWNGVRHVGSC